jgi:1,4-alpha-glucan branching enzyme
MRFRAFISSLVGGLVVGFAVGRLVKRFQEQADGAQFGLAGSAPGRPRDVPDVEASEPPPVALDAPSPGDDLQEIRGVGPVFARRLYAAGVLTYADLAGLSPDRLREIVQAQNWQKIDPEAWIATAKVMAER